ncbi:MAG: nucleotidyltransferase domain-containing protein [Trichlorobacter sp.]|jgi:predicted nucleotidyltransferase|nr:nucleotidyltransferase domain-containing protein [Trichlorobacter sp.]
MATSTDTVIEVIKKYLHELNLNGIPINQAFLFGSFVKGTAKEESDIDIALISEAFTGDRFDDRRRIVPLRRNIDNRLEPIPFSPENFASGGILIDEITKTGIRIV